MKNISPSQQARLVTGEFLARQDKMSGNAKQQQDRIMELAKYPGRNSSNANQQDLAWSLLNMVTLLSTIQPSDAIINSSVIANTESAQKQISHDSYPGVRPAYPQGESLADRIAIPVLSNSPGQRPNPQPSEYQLKSRLLRQATSYATAWRNEKENIAVISHDKKVAEPELIDEQNNAIDTWLLESPFKPQTTHKFHRLNSITDYINKNVTGHVTEVAKLLLSASNSYGAEQAEVISANRAWAVIAEYFNEIIFGMSIEEWLLQKVQKINTDEHQLFDHGNLQRTFTNAHNANLAGASLSPGTRKFYQDNILANLLPTFILQLKPQERAELEKMDIRSAQWGFIHAGARLLNYYRCDLSDLTLEDLADVGVTLDTLLRQGVIPQEFTEFFFLPALFLQASRGRPLITGAGLDGHEIQQALTQYFAHSAEWIKQNNPVTRLPDLIDQWQSRPQLARKVLKENNVPVSFLNRYLDQHQETVYRYDNGKTVTLPDIDNVFHQQNKKIEETAFEADNIIMPYAFNAASQDTQNFIMGAAVNRVQATFSAAKVIRDIPLSKSTRMGIDSSGALECHVPDKYDLLQCINNGEERIYILRMKNNGEYLLTQANPLRDDLAWLLEKLPPGGLSDYELKIAVDANLKTKENLPLTLIQKLATLHSTKLRHALAEQGYEKTINEKVKDFLLNLIPFYTCINESVKGNREAAVSACMLDVLNLVPFVGSAANTGIRFGTSLAKTTALALSWSSRQLTLKNMLKQAGSIYLNQFPSIAKEISPHVMQNLGIIFLRSIDPGAELLAKSTFAGAKAIENVLAKIEKKGHGLNELANSLKNLNAKSLPELVSEKYPTRTLFSKLHGRNLELAAIGKQNGRQVWVQFDRETGELFGRKYFISDRDILEPVPSPLATRLKLIKEEGFGGTGAVKKTWPSERQAAVPSDINRTLMPREKTDLVDGIPVKMRIYGEPGGEALLYPEVNDIMLRTTAVDIEQYKNSLATLSPDEQAALRTWIAPGEPLLIRSDGSYEMVSNISLDINEKLIKGLPLTPHEKYVYENLLSAINSNKIAGIAGDYLHITHYTSGYSNPWLMGMFEVNDYVTGFPMIMSLSNEPAFAATAIKEAASVSTDIESFIIFQVENARHAFPLISSALAYPHMENDFIYPPRTFLKVKSFTVSQPYLPVELRGDKKLYQAKRIAVILIEVDAHEAAQITAAKNLFNGFRVEITASQPVLPPYKTLPPLPGKHDYWEDIRKLITAPQIPPPSDVKFTELQKLETFIPEIPLQVSEDTNLITQKIAGHINRYFPDMNWRAYSGLSGNVPPEISWIQKEIRSHCEESLRKLTHVDNILRSIPEHEAINSDIGKYIIGLTPTDDPAIVKEVFRWITKVFNRARIFMEASKDIDYSNFIIVAGDLFPVPDPRQKYISLLGTEALARLPKACTHKFDAESRIIIFADQFYGNNPDGAGIRLSIGSSPEFKVHQSIIHEITHLTSLSSDLFLHAVPYRETVYSALLARHNFIRALTPSDTPGKAAPIWGKPDFVRFMQNVVNYQNVDRPLDYSSVITSIEKDPMLSANIFYSDAEVLALIANDIDAGRRFDALFRAKREVPANSQASDNYLADALLLLSFFLDATTDGLIHLNAELPQNNNMPRTVKQVKKLKLNGVNMDLQIYGDKDNSQLLFPEKYPWMYQKKSPSKKAMNKTMRNLSLQDKIGLNAWKEFADQHPVLNAEAAQQTINEKIIKGVPLNPSETIIYNNARAVMHSGKIPGFAGDFIRIVQYSDEQSNPWLNDTLDINDYLTTSQAFMSVASDTKFALSEIEDPGKPEKTTNSIVLYKVENGTHALPIPPLPRAQINTHNEFLYPPDSLFRVKSLAISLPTSTEAGYENSQRYRVPRVAVTLVEVSPEEAKDVTLLKNIFDGSARHFLKKAGG